MLEKRSYFELTSQFKFLLHTWSLSVEIQYYFIAPLLYFILHRTYGKHFILSIIHCSLFLQWTFRGTTFEFDLLFCRLWQFLIGTLVLLLAKENEIESESKVSNSKNFYLVHWPVILFGRYSNIDSNTYGFVSIVMICIVVSVLLYEFLDKIVPTITTLFISVQTGVIFGVILMICFYSPSLKPNIPEKKIELSKDPVANLSIKEVIQINEKFGATCSMLPINNCYNDTTLYEIFHEIENYRLWNHNCVVDFHPNGTKIVALLGNSFATRFSITAVKVLKEFPSVKKMYLISRASCTVFDTLLKMENAGWHCEKMIGKNIDFVKRVRPDVIINIARYNQINKIKLPIPKFENLQNSAVTFGIKKELAEYEKYVNKIILFEPSPLAYNSVFKGPGDISRILTFNHTSPSFDSLALSRGSVEMDLNPAWTRVKAGIADCKNCTVIPTFDLFCGKQKCPVAESSGISRYCDIYHLSEAGTDLMLPRLKNALKGIL
ncbi:hypothetical protein FO519_007688 [Halicephalobus sp. NKZ332]|nr:hypothetical protein FO519_007688 [Halicephalobus sp. NKZ332]